MFLGIVAQSAALLWLWRDWQMGQYERADWVKRRGKSETQTLRELVTRWDKFTGGQEKTTWDEIASEGLMDLVKLFPISGDEGGRKRTIDASTARFGVGPTDSDLATIGDCNIWRYCAGASRKRTFVTATQLVAFGLALQLIGSWPSRRVIWFEAQVLEMPAAKQ